MRKRRITCVLGLTLILSFSAQVYGWGNGGHMAVAAVAYDRLTPQVRARADALVRLNPRFSIWQGMLPRRTRAADRPKLLFMIAATWADQIKGDGHVSDGPDGGNRPPTDGTAARNIGYPDTAMHKYWHFIDLPFTQDGSPTTDPPEPNALTQIDAFRAVLSSDNTALLKSYDMVWLLHLVGDVHQPLHCAARFIRGDADGDGDDGGNEVTVCDPACNKKLHSFWDGLLGTSEDPVPARTLAQGLPAAPARAAGNLRASDWIDEGLDLAKRNVYKRPIEAGSGPFRITEAYRNAARTLARRRVALAGARLANILNSELTSTGN
jgi:hypothetical protein